ncbi:MAG: hypothetical protein RPU39_00145 [Candidatus Sedimenticola sp. (ex Thyasira tokunagai)]
MARHEGWEKRLMAEVRAAEDKTFKWGEFDCALFAADCVKAITGADLAADFRGHYTTAKGSLKALKKYGAGDLESTATRQLGNPIDTRLAMRGDVVMVNSDSGPALAVCMGSNAVVPGVQGLTSILRSQWLCAWRV